jgi:hypothetical protein
MKSKTNPAPSQRPSFASGLRTGKQANLPTGRRAELLNMAQDTGVVFLVKESATADAMHNSPSLPRPKVAGYARTNSKNTKNKNNIKLVSKKTFQKDGHWIEKIDRTPILLCTCGNKYIKTRPEQTLCLRCFGR